MPSGELINYKKLTDEELICKFQEGSTVAYTEIVYRYKDKLVNFVYRYVGNYDDCEDIAQDALVKVYTSKHLYKEIAKFSTWVYTIAINLAKTKAIKKQKMKTFSLSDAYDDEDKDFDIPDEAFTPDIDVNAKFLNQHIQNALNQINENYRELVILRDVEDLSYEEIVDITGLPMGTVKSRINRGREKLQELLKDIYKE
ncbi:MAG TPA: sigma-70 family RNA polymerase sigma factor [Ignavibacteria bacterium]|jgi:RNA polymerase sigma-70 factor (ECF subfamily)